MWKLKGFFTVLSNRESNRCMLFLVTTWTSTSMVRIGGDTCSLAAYGGSIRPWHNIAKTLFPFLLKINKYYFVYRS